MPSLREMFAAGLRHARRARGLTQARLAEMADISLDMVSRIERAEASPSFETIDRLATALAVDAASLFGPARLLELPGTRADAMRRLFIIAADATDSDLMRLERLAKALLSDS